MNFFDVLINDTQSMLAGLNSQSYGVNSAWEDIGRNELILQRDSAYELDGVGYNLVTSADIGGDGIVVIGDDVNTISSDRKFARISFIQIDDIDDEQKAYDLIRKIEYAKYHFFPKGYMIRTASRSHKESVRISKSAISDGMSFQKVGSLLINKYKENKAVRAVRIAFVTDKSADYKAFESIAKKNYEITETLNHIMNNVNFDCSTCNLKPICDEVEGMRELHFKNAGMG
ncbi:MAG: hypothetical protein ACLUFN_07485 [Eubacterium sp.]